MANTLDNQPDFSTRVYIILLTPPSLIKYINVKGQVLSIQTLLKCKKGCRKLKNGAHIEINEI